jgi:GGDEF domain-containing protein
MSLVLSQLTTFYWLFFPPFFLLSVFFGFFFFNTQIISNGLVNLWWMSYASLAIAQRTKEHSDFASIMKQADIALYAAKKAGRNCVKEAKQ